MQQSLKDMPDFYKTAVECFIRFTKPNRIEPKQLEQVYNEPLFHNALTAKESLLVEESWANSGVSLLRHICYEYVPGFLSEDAIKELVGGEYRRGLLGAVVRQLPKKWVEIVNSIPAPASRRSENFEVLLVNNETKIFSKLNSKAIYNVLICNEKPTLVFKTYWETLLGPINWELVFESRFKSNDDRKCSDIQWKLLQHVMQTADRLCRHKILKNPKYQRCLVNDETEVHCFLYCPEVRKLWKKVVSLITAYNPDAEIKKLLRFVVVGFLDVKKSNETHLVEKCLGDLAIKTIWSTRNAIVFDNEQKDLMSIYTGKLKRKMAIFKARNTEYGIQNMEYGIWNMEYGIWNMEYGTWNMEYGIQNMEYGIWNTEYGIRNMEYGIWYMEYGIRNMEYGIRNTEYGIRNMEYGTWNMEYGIWNTEYGIWNTEYGIWNTEYGIRNMEYGIRNMEYGICNTEYGIRKQRILFAFLYSSQAESWD